MNYKSTEAIKWFRTDTFIYRLINKALRTEDFNTLYLFQFFIVDLSKQLENEFHKFNKTNKQVTNRILRVYRSLKITQDERKKFEKSIGKLILMNGYLSATYQREITYESIAKQKIRDDEAKVLFEYIIDFNNVKSVMFANISSQYNQSEEINDEILFDLGTTFKINSCKYHEKDQIWLINVIGTDEGTHVATEYIQYQKSKVIHSNIMLMLGHLIIETGNYDKAENYFDAFLHSSVPNDEEIACIYYNIGRIYRLKGEYQRALEFLNRSYISHSHARPARLFSAAKTMNAIGIVCIELKDIPRAVDSFECALRLYGKTVEEHHPDVGGTLINLGNIYSEQAYFDDALSCFQRAQKIYEQNFPANHPNIALLLNNIGNLYYEQKNFHLALDAYQHALKINEKILPAHHSTLVRNKDNLSKVYLSLAELQSDKPPEYTSLNIDTFIEPTSNMEINNVHKLNSN